MDEVIEGSRLEGVGDFNGIGGKFFWGGIRGRRVARSGRDSLENKVI